MEEMATLLDWGQTYGISIIFAFLCGYVLVKLITRIMDENKEREQTTAKTLGDISNTIKESAETNKSLAETNRLIVDKLTYDVQEIDANVQTILDKLNKEE